MAVRIPMTALLTLCVQSEWRRRQQDGHGLTPDQREYQPAKRLGVEHFLHV